MFCMKTSKSGELLARSHFPHKNVPIGGFHVCIHSFLSLLHRRLHVFVSYEWLFGRKTTHSLKTLLSEPQNKALVPWTKHFLVLKNEDDLILPRDDLKSEIIFKLDLHR